MTSTSSTTAFLQRPVVAGSLTAILDIFVLGQRDYYKSLKFGTAVGVAVATADGLSGSILKAINVNAGDSGITMRVSEIVFASGSAYLLNSYIGSSYRGNNNHFMKEVGVIVLADIASNAILDLFNSQPVSFFN